MSPHNAERLDVGYASRVDAGAAVAIAIMLTRFPTLTLFTEEIKGSVHMGLGPAGCIYCGEQVSARTIEAYTQRLTKALTQQP